MRVAFHTLGCKVNQNDTDSLAQLFRQRGHDIVPFEPGVDIYIINTCVVTQLGEKKSRQIVHKAVGYQPKLVVVTGCYPQVSPEEAAAISGVDLVIGMAERPRIVELVEETLEKHEKLARVNKIEALTDWVSLPVSIEGERTRANLKIEEGCDQFCSYCIIPYARGPVRSMPVAQVVKEIKTLLEAGYKEIVLSGIHLGAYGKDIGADLNTVLTSILNIETEFRIRLGSLEPVDLTDKLIETVVNHPKVCQYLHIPLQSGSESILKRMNRDYTLQDYASLLRKLRAGNPQIAIGTDLIVGFPGETAEDFVSTCNFIADQFLSKIHVFRYSPRKGTPAAGFANRVSKAVQEERSKTIAAIAAEMNFNYMRQFVGNTVSVLFEESSAKTWSGFTGEYIRMEVATDQELRNTLKQVLVTGVQQNNLVGKIID
ncbi:MAG TPA: tRNA (N(6)-L-threonylcarbamoyladenosine(37)-C(2))-methylthiotransferase MtaB [Bacillota bacterium]|nr:tRNA (N(6)-L-threonylcarbamoyladenosine(37)-C(2))-methylthiotransferase MtaB [Bacillota bacterium]